jgi:hypothetical protein
MGKTEWSSIRHGLVFWMLTLHEQAVKNALEEVSHEMRIPE